jgi:ribonuclease Y
MMADRARHRPDDADARGCCTTWARRSPTRRRQPRHRGRRARRRVGETETSCTPSKRTTTRVEPRTVEAILVQAPTRSAGRPAHAVSRCRRTSSACTARGACAGCEASTRCSRCRRGARCGSWCCPDVVDDIQAQVLARDLVKRIEEELTYPARSR